MHKTMNKTLSMLALAALLGCGDMDVPDLNNLGSDTLEQTPTRQAVINAATGLIIGSRNGLAAANGYVSQLAILGREAYNLDNADPRYVTEMLEGQLDPGSPAFGGNFWALPYRNLRNARTLDRALDNPALNGTVTDTEKRAFRGYLHTIEALDYLHIINTRDTTGAVDVHQAPDARGLYPLVSKEAIFDRIHALLDEGYEDLLAGGTAFPFPLSKGFTGFNTPATFGKFNRALKARVSAYTQDWQDVQDALDLSFIDEDLNAQNAATKMALGVSFTYTTDSNDARNGLNAAVLYVHPNIVSAAEINNETTKVDARVSGMTAAAKAAGSYRGLSATQAYTKYTSASSPLPIMRNEELLLLRAEAHIAQGNLAEAETYLNLVRVFSGQLRTLAEAGKPLTAENAVDELLKQRRYSLMFEGGHSWIDYRRYGKLDQLPIEKPVGFPEHRMNTAFPLPQAELDARK